VRAEAHGHLRRVCADDAAADDDDARCRNSGHAAQKHAAPAAHLLQILRADLNRHASRHFRHRRQERKRAFLVRDRLVGHARHFAFEQLFGEFEIGREMQVSEEHLAFAHARVFGRNRLFHFHDHLALRPHFVSRFEYLCARAFVQRIFEAGAFARPALHHYLVSGIGQRTHTGRRHPHPILVVFDLFRQSD
jgi:hypothetical protein